MDIGKVLAVGIIRVNSRKKTERMKCTEQVVDPYVSIMPANLLFIKKYLFNELKLNENKTELNQ